MKRIVFTSALFFFSFLIVSAQNDFDLVYEIFQNKCNNCHGNNSPQGGLNLEGAGSNLTLKKISVYNNLVNKTPANAMAASTNIKLVERGRADLSFLFQKINKGLDPWVRQIPGSGQPMPMAGELTDLEKETIRQWILYGADRSSDKFDENIIEKFYSEGGNVSYPDGPPPAPAPGEGFQIKMGPFYLDESGTLEDELEFFTKYDLNLPEALEVQRIDLNISNYSHHLIIYDFGNSNGGGLAPGLRLEADHSDIGLVAAIQEPTDLVLPEGTAFRWKKDLVLDLNAHYINYSPQGVYQAEAYINIYTQPNGTAVQEMHTDLLVNYNIPIPNNGEIITHSDIINPSAGELFVWGMVGHTHKYGKNYKAFRRNNSQKGEIIYDAACPRGIPDCSTPFFDYRHIPVRYFEPFVPILFNFSNGLIHEAQWVNNGPTSVNFGPTSDNEMMVMVLMFTTDTTGLNVSGTEKINKPLSDIEIYPTPAEEQININFSKLGDYHLQFFDAAGKKAKEYKINNSQSASIDISEMRTGLYFLQILDSSGMKVVKKVIIQNE